MFKRLFTGVLVFGAAALAPPLLHAQTAQCLPREALIKSLETKYSENLTGGGLQSSKQLLEVWSSSKTGSFTIFVTQPNGVSCIVATGKHWSTKQSPKDLGVAG